MREAEQEALCLILFGPLPFPALLPGSIVIHETEKRALFGRIGVCDQQPSCF